MQKTAVSEFLDNSLEDGIMIFNATIDLVRTNRSVNQGTCVVHDKNWENSVSDKRSDIESLNLTYKAFSERRIVWFLNPHTAYRYPVILFQGQDYRAIQKIQKK